MAYTKQVWKNLPDKTTPFTAERMNHIEQGISDLYDAIFPIGQIVIKGDNEDYSNWLGFTWERTAVGKVLVGIDSSDTDFDTIGKTGGEKTHKLTINELASHDHKYIGFKSFNAQFNGSSQTIASAYASDTSGPELLGGSIANSGGSQPHNNLQPYQVVAYWKRVA